MSDNKDKFNINNILSDIDFDEIGYSIKNSVNATIKAFSKSKKSKDHLPQTMNKEVCEQRPPELGKAKGFYALAILLGLGFFISFLVSASLFLDYRGFFYFLTTLVTLGLTAIAPYISYRASKEYDRLSSNYVRFLRELGNNTVISIRDLASSVAQSEEKTVSDLTKMMKRGYFHQARIVEDDSLFILDIPTFKLYKDKKKEVPEVRIQSEQKDEALVEDLSFERAQEIISLGKNTLEDMIKINDKINNRDFRENVGALIKSSEDILTIVEKYPDKSYALNKFEDYYLPTSAKLIETYYDFEAMRTSEAKITKSMEQIDQSIVTIGEAFEKIKVELLSDRAMDIKTDIDTINLLLNQEGLTKDDWRKE